MKTNVKKLQLDPEVFLHDWALHLVKLSKISNALEESNFYSLRAQSFGASQSLWL